MVDVVAYTVELFKNPVFMELFFVWLMKKMFWKHRRGIARKFLG